MLYEVGMRVKINADGFTKYGEGEFNPEGVEGVVVGFTPDKEWANVLFDNGVENNYEDGYLTIIQ